ATGSNISMRFLVSDFEKVGWPWFVLMGCLLLTFLLSAWIMGLMRRNVEVQEMVRIRTAELESEKRKAENANSAKSRFLANMSHEVRTPLNIILGMTELLTETELEEQQLSNLKTISRSAYHLLSLIEDILEMNRLEADELELANDRFNIKMVVNEVVRFVATPIRTKKLRFHYYISPDVPRFLVGDARRLKQVILNLINNSLKFTDSGFVSLEIRVLKSNGNHVELEFVVSDSGIGIKNEDRERIFKSFVQLDPSSTRNKGGVGLGLSIVKTYVEKMGGLVEIDSNVEVGTRIRAKLGFELADGMSRWIDAYDLRADLIGKRVYVLCSSDIDFQNISDSLEYFGAIVEHEKSGQKFASDFLEVVDRNDFLILDSDLDDMGAVEGLGLNRKLLKKTDRMIVLLHQKHRKDDVAILNSMGIERICFRPLLFNEFFKALQFGKTYSSKPYRSESKPVEGIVPNTLPVLIAEDDPDNRVLIGAFLKPMNLNLTFASDGLDALEKFKKIRPQIVITDIQMPRLDGFGFLKAAQEHLETERESQECYFMVLTADAMPEQIAEAKKYGVEEYLTKPIRKKDLIQKTIKAYEALMKSEG
ncbi:MAG: response regulator, partial [Bdellovibrionales bacterium]|nr:response regulator [Bdellovibrionales bacterium]